MQVVGQMFDPDCGALTKGRNFLHITTGAEEPAMSRDDNGLDGRVFGAGLGRQGQLTGQRGIHTVGRIGAVE